MTPGLSVEQTNAILNRQSQEQPNQNPFKGRTLVRSRGNHSARPVQVQNEPEPVTYANISVQYDYLNPGTSNGCDEKKSNDIPKGKIFLITTLRSLIKGQGKFSSSFFNALKEPLIVQKQTIPQKKKLRYSAFLQTESLRAWQDQESARHSCC